MEEDNEIKLINDTTISRQSDCIQKICYGFGHVYNDLCAAIWFSYMLFYFQIILLMESTIAGFLIMIGQVADSLATPAAGWAIDRIGHPKAWHLAGTIFVTFGFSLIFSINLDNSLWWYFIYFGSLVIFFQIGWAIVQISHLSVIPALSNNHVYSSSLTAIRYTATVLSNITVYLITWIILDYNGTPVNVGPEDFTKFRELVLISTTIGIICSVIFYMGVRWKEQIVDETPLQNGNHKEVPIQNESILNRHFLKSLLIYLVSLMYMSSRMYTVLNLIYIPLYLEERSDIDVRETITVRSAVAIVPLVSFCGSFLASVLLNYKSQYIDDKVVYLTGSITSLCGSVWIATGVPLGSYYLIYIPVCFIGVGSSATIVSSLCLTARFAKINGCKGASIYSLVTFTDKLISGAVIFLIQYFQCTPKEQCPNYYKNVLAYACSTASILGMISLILLHYRTLNINKI